MRARSWIVSALVFLASPCWLLGQSTTITFDQFTGPRGFSQGFSQSPQPPFTVGIATFSNGQLLTNVFNLPADTTTVYGTMWFPPITINFSQPVANFSVLVLNGITEFATYTVADDVCPSQDVTLPPVFRLDSGAVVSRPSIGIRQVTITSQFSQKDFFIDNVSFTPLPAGSGSGCPAQDIAADLGPCPQCEAQAGAPLSLVNGNVYVQHRDYSLPGLGGGLGLVRTWNSRWQDVSPPSVAGMFGHSWRSNYEESLNFPNSNTLKLLRGDGKAWTFSFNSATNTYSVSSPPDEHATIQFNSVTTLYTLALADGSKKIFNQAGYLVNLLDRNGNLVTLSRDGSNRLTQVTDAAGRSINFSYNDPNNANQATSVQDGLGTIATYAYDSSARLVRVTYADGSGFNFAYDTASSMLTSVTDAQGKLIESHTYDTSHRGLTSGRALGADSLTISYPTSGQTQLSDSMGNTSSYGYQSIGGRRFISSIGGSGCASCGGRGNQSLTYDSLGNRTSSTDALGRTTTFTYDANGNVLSRSIQFNSTTTLTWSFTYNQFQQVLTATDPLGNTTTNTYDANGNLLSTATPPPATGQQPSTTTFQYDAKGQLVKTIDPLGNATTIAYTPVGLIASTTDALGKATTFAYDARGNRTSTTDALLNTTTFTYDVMNRLTKITQADGSNTSFAYDTRGRRTSVTDANGKLTAYQYDDADRLVSVTDAAGNVTAYGYDTENHLASITDALGRITSFSYDPLGRVTKVTFPSTLAETYTYDSVGNLLSKTDRKSQAITYTYDALDRLTRKQFPDTTGVNYTYDALSRLTQAVDPTGTYAFTYDNLGRLTQTATSYSFLTSRTLTNNYSYDAASNRIAFTNPEAGITSYTYDSLNRLTALRDFNANAFTFSYDALGRRTSLNRPNLVNTSYTYDSLSRLLSIVHQQGLVGAGTSYSYDAVGNRTSRTDSAVGAGQVVQSYTYDSIYQLTQAVVSTVPPTTTETYTYDKVGNRLSSLGVPAFTYNGSNQLLSAQITPLVAANFTYDANGNTLSKTDASGTTIYAWDFENRLTSVTLPGTGGTVNFKYDPFGRRIQKSAGLAVTNYAYDGDNAIEELNATGAVVAQYTQSLGIDEPLAMYRSGVASFYHADGLGSIQALTDATGIPAAAYVYDSFGNLLASTGVTNPFRYTAREFDSETGLYYYRARYYEPGVGRFLSEDMIAFNAGVNFYSYVANNPVILFDPLGLEATAGCDTAKKLALKRLRDPDCKAFVESTLKKAFAVSNGAGPVAPSVLSAQAASSTAVFLASHLEHAAIVTDPKANFVAFTVGGNTITLGKGFSLPGNDRAETLIHEAFHLIGYGQLTDVTLAIALQKKFPLGKDAQETLNNASNAWDPVLRKHCGSR